MIKTENVCYISEQIEIIQQRQHLSLQAVYLFWCFVTISEKPAAAISTLNRQIEEVSKDKFILNYFKEV